MHFKPKRWTEHHHLRLFHASMLAAFLMICVVIFFGVLFIFANSFVKADAGPIDANVTTSATVPEVSSGTTTPISEGGGGWFYVPAANSTPDYHFPPATITLKADPAQATAKTIASATGTGQTTVYVFKNNQPRFLGETNVDRGVIVINIEGPLSFSSSAQTVGTAWQWQSPEQLPPGYYRIRATVWDLKYQGRVASAVLDFAVGQPGAPPAAIRPAGGSGAALYLLAKVPDNFKVVYPGQQVGVVVGIINQNWPAKNLVLEYTISNSRGEVTHSQDVVAVGSGGTEFLKSFYINPLAEAGDYTVTVRIHSEQKLFSAADGFSVRGRGIIQTSSQLFVDFTAVLQILLVLLLLFGLIAYFEYNKVTMMSRIIKQVTEEDLRKEEEKK